MRAEHETTDACAAASRVLARHGGPEWVQACLDGLRSDTPSRPPCALHAWPPWLEAFRDDPDAVLREA